jgi:hypothetical protein
MMVRRVGEGAMMLEAAVAVAELRSSALSRPATSDFLPFMLDMSVTTDAPVSVSSVYIERHQIYER